MQHLIHHGGTESSLLDYRLTTKQTARVALQYSSDVVKSS